MAIEKRKRTKPPKSPGYYYAKLKTSVINPAPVRVINTPDGLRVRTTYMWHNNVEEFYWFGKVQQIEEDKS